MSTQIRFVSLMEHLRKVAGKELGAQIYEAAKKIGVPIRTREVSTPNYTGIVMLYPQSFLEMYFELEPYLETKQPVDASELDPRDTFTVGDAQDNDLPF